MTLPESVKAAIEADVQAYRAKIETEARVSMAIHMGERIPEVEYGALARARTEASWAHQELANAIIREGSHHG